jgi:hypothetical protein
VRGIGKRADGGANINNIELVTNQGHVVSGGKTGDVDFAMPLQPDRFVLGFFGFVRDGFCRSIGVHHDRFLDAQWHPID